MSDVVEVDQHAALLAGLESILFLAAEPVPTADLSLALELGQADVEALLEELTSSLREAQRGVVVRHAGGGWRLYAAETGQEHVERFVLAGRSGRLSQAALETLAVIAYKQPISRSDIGEVRGVNADGAVRSLAARGLVTEVGRDEGPGQAVLYGTTQDFLVKLGIDRLEDLPPLSDYLIDDEAPDEPAPDQLRAARKLLQLGQRLPSTGAARWTPDGELVEDDDPDEAQDGDAAGEADGEVADQAELAKQAAAQRLRARTAQVERRRDQESEMTDLTDRMESVASAAMSRLQSAVEAAEPPDDESVDEPEHDDDQGEGVATDAASVTDEGAVLSAPDMDGTDDE